MKGLLLKDFYTLVKQLKLYLVFIVILALLPNMNLPAIATIYAAMLPITALAYDEKSKWDQIAVMMPYTRRDLVLSKYVIGYIGIAICTLLSFGIQLVIGALNRQPMTIETVLIIVVSAFAALVLIALNLPFIFWMGVERGRIIFLVLIAVSVFIGMMSADSIQRILAVSTIPHLSLIHI